MPPEIRTWEQAVIDAHVIIKKSRKNPFVQFAKGLIPGANALEAITGEELLTGDKLTPKERIKAGAGEALSMAIPLLRRLRP